MCFNVFPRCKSLLHFVAEDKDMPDKENHLQEIFTRANSGKFNEGQPLNIPIFRDIEGKTPIDICLDAKTLNLNLADLLFLQTKDYPLLHSSYLLYSAVVRAIEHELPSIGQYLDARLVESNELRVDPEFSHLCIKDEQIILKETLSFSEFSIWENKSVIKDRLFTTDGFVRSLSLCYFDIPNINDRSAKSN